MTKLSLSQYYSLINNRKHETHSTNVWSKVKDETPFRYAHTKVQTQVIVICDQLDHGGDLYRGEQWLSLCGSSVCTLMVERACHNFLLTFFLTYFLYLRTWEQPKHRDETQIFKKSWIFFNQWHDCWGWASLLPPTGNPLHFSAGQKSEFLDKSGKVSSVITLHNLEKSTNCLPYFPVDDLLELF